MRVTLSTTSNPAASLRLPISCLPLGELGVTVYWAGGKAACPWPALPPEGVSRLVCEKWWGA